MISRFKGRPGASAVPEAEIYKLREGDRPPVVAVHGAGGILCFANLSRHMAPDQPFYVVQGKGLDQLVRRSGFSNVHELADAYVDAIVNLAVGRPLFICGRWTPIVLETGRALVARGHDVAALIVFDARPWGAARPASSNSEPQAVFNGARLAKRIPGATALLQLRALVRSTWRLYSPEMQRRGREQPLKMINWRLTSGYTSRSFPGKVVLVRSKTYAGRTDKSNHVPLWRSLSRELDVHVAAGGHARMWRSPYVEPFAALLQQILDDTVAARDTAASPDPARETPPVGARSPKPQ